MIESWLQSEFFGHCLVTLISFRHCRKFTFHLGFELLHNSLSIVQFKRALRRVRCVGGADDAQKRRWWLERCDLKPKTILKTDSTRTKVAGHIHSIASVHLLVSKQVVRWSSTEISSLTILAHRSCRRSWWLTLANLCLANLVDYSVTWWNSPLNSRYLFLHAGRRKDLRIRRGRVIINSIFLFLFWLIVDRLVVGKTGQCCVWRWKWRFRAFHVCTGVVSLRCRWVRSRSCDRSLLRGVHLSRRWTGRDLYSRIWNGSWQEIVYFGKPSKKVTKILCFLFLWPVQYT